jgi:hypothetical protein
MADVIEKQRLALERTIKEASAKEKSRIRKIASVKSKSDMKVLLNRFEQERQLDQERVERLTNDFFTLKKCQEDGTLAPLIERRTEFKQAHRNEATLNEFLPNRFSGMEDHDDQVCPISLLLLQLLL